MSGLAGDDSTREVVLVERVRQGDPDARMVFADLLEGRGQHDRAGLLRSSQSLLATWASLGHWLCAMDLLGQALVSLPGGHVAFGVGCADKILPNSEARIIARPQREQIRFTRIVVPDGLATAFSLCDVLIGNRSQLERSVPVPCSLFLPVFAESGFGPVAFRDVCNTAMDVTLVVRNTGPVPRSFFALLLGLEVDDQ